LYGVLTSAANHDLIFCLSRNALISSGDNGNRIKVKNPLFFSEARSEGLKKVYLYNDASHDINSIDVSAGNKKISIGIIADDIDTRAFFIKNMNSQKYHIVYIYKSENCIIIKELK
jgi:hypothetical protein